MNADWEKLVARVDELDKVRKKARTASDKKKVEKLRGREAEIKGEIKDMARRLTLDF